MRALTLGLLLSFSDVASAEVVSADAHNFEVRQAVELAALPAEAFAAFTRVGNWWSKDHTWSGDAANLSFDVRPGGCWCERLPNGGGVEHLRVVLVRPGKEMVLTGSLGPLVYEAAAGSLHLTFEAVGAGTRLTLDYRVSGFSGGAADKLAPVVDVVLGQQLACFRTLVASNAASP